MLCSTGKQAPDTVTRHLPAAQTKFRQVRASARQCRRQTKLLQDIFDTASFMFWR